MQRSCRSSQREDEGTENQTLTNKKHRIFGEGKESLKGGVIFWVAALFLR